MAILDKNLSLRNRNKILVGVWEDEDALVDAAHALVDKGIHIHDIYTPYPVHGLDRIIGVKRSKLARVAFFCGLTGLILMVTMIWYMYVIDWPINIGNKPVRFTPSWIPVMFEGTVLCTAYGMGFFFFWRNRMLFAVKNDLLDDRQTDDRLVVAIETVEGMNEAEVVELMKSKGAVETKEFQAVCK
jgi:hypothetical protein